MVNEQIRNAIEQCASQVGTHVVDVVVRGERNSMVIEVFVDSEGGITAETCAIVSREVETTLERNQLVRGHYRLEVSSPGIDTALKFPWQYKKHIGRQLHLRTHRENQLQDQEGKFVAMDESGVMLEFKRQGERLRIPFDEIVEATVKAPW
jgi:ribosome maturation factor RimP